MAVEFAKDAVFAHVPGDFHTNSPDYRLDMLKYWAKRGIVRTVTGLPLINRKKIYGERKLRRHMFVLIFKSHKAFVRICGKTVKKGKGIMELEHK